MNDVLAMSAGSKEYLYFENVKAFDSRSPDAPADPTSFPVKANFRVIGGAFDATAWKDAEWVDTSTARIRIGAGTAVPLTPGSYAVWLSVVGEFEAPERVVAQLIVHG